jgi:hypothetical protein
MRQDRKWEKRSKEYYYYDHDHSSRTMDVCMRFGERPVWIVLDAAGGEEKSGLTLTARSTQMGIQ